MLLESIITLLSGLAGVAALLWNIYNHVAEKRPKLEMLCPYNALITDEDISTKQQKKVVCIQAKIANLKTTPVVPYWHTLQVRVLTADGWNSNCTVVSHRTPPIISNNNTQVEGYIGIGQIPYFSLHDITPITRETPYVKLFPVAVDSISNLHSIREIEFKFKDCLKRNITIKAEIRIMNLPTQ